jgi:MYXO-CTERM domain-containing protein
VHLTGAGILDGSGTIAGDVLIDAGTTLQPGDSSDLGSLGILTCGSLTGSANAVLVMDLSGTNNTNANAPQYDQLLLTGPTGASVNGVALQLFIPNTFVPITNDKFYILDSASAPVTGFLTFGGTTLTENATFVTSGRAFRVNYNAPGDPLATGRDVLLTYTGTSATPEPNALALLASLGALALRRRRH